MRRRYTNERSRKFCELALLFGAPITLGQVVGATVQQYGFLEVELHYEP
ncbi:MAG: hypothetical protein ACOY93_06560 [Bacillota bacterium]